MQIICIWTISSWKWVYAKTSLLLLLIIVVNYLLLSIIYWLFIVIIINCYIIFISYWLLLFIIIARIYSNFFIMKVSIYFIQFYHLNEWLTMKACGSKISLIKALGDNRCTSNAMPWARKLAKAKGRRIISWSLRSSGTPC